MPQPDDAGAPAADGFALDPRLALATIPVARWRLSLVLLMNDRRFPWLLLVPRRAGAVELIDLTPRDGVRLAAEIRRASVALKQLCGPAKLPVKLPVKLNVAALGNQVSQLHIHIVARRAGDAAWPNPVWGSGQAVPYEADEARDMVRRLGPLLAAPDRQGGRG